MSSPHISEPISLAESFPGYMPVYAGYDCRIVFSIERDKEKNNEVIILLDIGTHDEVY